MAGIYIHIPFCKKKCSYCDFHFSTSLSKKDDIILCLIKELEIRKNYLNENIETIYFGGGTPSLLSKKEIMSIIDKIYKLFNVIPDVEITLEANPNDLTKQKINDLKKSAINRFSIGVQSFQNNDLKFMHREHTAQQAKKCIEDAQDSGWQNISIDLIYGSPNLKNEKWIKNLNTAINLNIPHISAYSLTIEKNTLLHKMVEKKICNPIDDQKTKEQFLIMMELLEKNKYIHYEISNFSKKDQLSIHNTNYWRNKSYLGIGPSAHSFNGIERQWNVSNNSLYIKSISKSKIPCEVEKLNEKDKYNEYILTSLRTIWGVNSNFIKMTFSSFFYSFFKENAQKWIKSGHILRKNEKITLSKKGKLFADKISSELFWTE